MVGKAPCKRLRGSLQTLELLATSGGPPCNPGRLLAISWASLLATVYGAPRNREGIPCNLRRCSSQSSGSPCNLVGRAPCNRLRGSLQPRIFLVTSGGAPCNPSGLLATSWAMLLATIHPAPCNSGAPCSRRTVLLSTLATLGISLQASTGLLATLGRSLQNWTVFLATLVVLSLQPRGRGSL